jgi:hypothetical protein
MPLTTPRVPRLVHEFRWIAVEIGIPERVQVECVQLPPYASDIEVERIQLFRVFTGALASIPRLPRRRSGFRAAEMPVPKWSE